MSVTTAGGSADRSIPGLRIIGNGSSAELVQAITSAKFTRPVSGAITLDVNVQDGDPRRPLLNSPILASRFYATFGGVNFEGRTINKRASTVALGFVDAVATALERQRGLLTIPADAQTRQAIAERLCREVGVQVVCDPEAREVVHSVVERKANSDSWALLGQLADDVGWRRFSDGRRVYFGSDAWLASLIPASRFREFTGPVHTIDFGLSVDTPANTITLDVDAELWAVPAGAPFTVEGLGLASGDWVVSEFSREVTRLRAQVTGTRRELVLPEPPAAQSDTPGESGEVNFVPDAANLTTPPGGTYGGTKITGVQAGNAVTIVSVALRRNVGNRGAILGLMTAMQESTLVNLVGGDRDSVGLFQQRPSQGWGTAAQCRNPEYAAGKFYDALSKVAGWEKLPYTVAAQRVQRSGFPDAYARWQGFAEALFAAIAKDSNTAVTSSATTGTGLDRVADEAIALTKRVTKYTYGGKTIGTGLDCSGFVAIATRNAGRELPGGSQQQYAAGQKRGVACSVAEALRTRGAILFRGSTTPSHIAVSLGDGRTAEARGSAQGVGVFPNASTRTWTGGLKWAA